MSLPDHAGAMPYADYDGAWKETLELFFKQFLEFCFPNVAREIDWSKPFKFLDRELQEVVRDAERGKMRVDSLVQVFLQDGSEEWILIHIEIQSQADPQLGKRMFFYFCRLGDRYDHPVVSLAVLADSAPDFKPSEYRRETCGCRLRFEYPVCKLMEFDPGQLEQSDNPVAVVIAAHLAAQKTARDMEHRLQVKWGLTRRLYERGYSKKAVLELYRLIDRSLISRHLRIWGHGSTVEDVCHATG
jgi:hypothetical protein